MPNDQVIYLKSSDIFSFMKNIKTVYSQARILSANQTEEFEYDENGFTGAKKVQCHALKTKGQKCEDCIACTAIKEKNLQSKLDFSEQGNIYVIYRHIDIDGKDYLLQASSKILDSAIYMNFEKKAFLIQKSDYEDKVYVDPLTGAYNRRYMLDHDLSKQGIRTVAMFDADNFKHINDTYGHAAGDEALKTYVSIIKQCVRKDDILIRLGGDEFILYLKNIPKIHLDYTLEKIRSRIDLHIFENYPKMHVTASIGYYHCGYGFDYNKATMMADRNLYVAKERRNCVISELQIE